MWEIRIQHDGLKAFRLIKGQTQADAQLKASLQISQWNEKWARLQKAETARWEKISHQNTVLQSKGTASALTAEATDRIIALESILQASLRTSLFLTWDSLKDKTPFAEPVIPPATQQPLPLEPPKEMYTAKLGILDKLISSRRQKKEGEAAAKYDEAIASWKSLCAEVTKENERASQETSKKGAEREDRKNEHKKAQTEQHANTEATKAAYEKHDKEAVEYFVSEILSHSIYPNGFPEESTIQYAPQSNTLIVEYELPSLAAWPTYKEVKYIATRDTLQEVSVSEAWVKKSYDDAIYQIALRVISELFAHDYAVSLKSICFNGWVRSVDKSTGNLTHACIMSVQVSRDEFMTINLAQVEPKACFRKLKGVASSKLVELTPIRPVITISHEDRRFVDAYPVLEAIDDRTNLASMDWLDFENLIREVFEKEFSKNGGEVKITQASRDGGVDAVAFDPDPIRGGKIVIQAKRYTNVVGVSAVRDLYGTVHNEGANKGILVTTSTYGPDAYEFAKGKPLTLLNGSELLYLLEKYGHRSKIDLVAARLDYRENHQN